jgi:hypothetical protein
MESDMRHILPIVTVIVLATAVHAHAKARHHAVKHHVASGVTVYDRDSANPNIGWHTDSSGLRSCSYDCDNPEIPGSGARCRTINFMGMAGRECVTGGGF